MSNLVISAFTEEQASKLSGVKQSQLKYWDSTDFFAPTLGAENRRWKHSRIYSFKDIVGLRTLKMLTDEYNISTRYLRKVREELRKPQDVWADTTIYVLGKRVYLEEPSVDTFREPTSGQLSLRHIPLRRVIGEVERAVAKIKKRNEETIGKIGNNRNISGNSNVVSGTRVPIATIQEYLAEGFTDQQILKEFPSLDQADIELVREGLGQGAA